MFGIPSKGRVVNFYFEKGLKKLSIKTNKRESGRQIELLSSNICCFARKQCKQ